jgi:tetratricopeptide (TPR) repeat protein
MWEKGGTIVVAVLLLGVHPGLVGSGGVDVGEQLDEADRCYRDRDYKAAAEIYEGIVARGSGGEEVFAARKRIVCSYIAMNKAGEAESNLERLLAEFGGHERLPHAVHEVAEECCKLGRGGDVEDLYERVLAAQPGHAQAVWLRMGVAICSVVLGADSRADSAVGDLVNEFGSDSRCAEAVSQVAWSYSKQKKHEDSRELYRLVMSTWPENERAIFAQRGIVLASIALGDDPNAAAGCEKLVKDYSGDERVAQVVSQVAEAYRDAKKYKEARTWHRYILEKHRGSGGAIWSQRGVILTSIELKDDPNTTAGIEKLLAEYAGHKDIACVVYQVGRKLNYRNDAKAQELYEYVRDRHPASEYAALARVNIGNLLLGGGDEKSAREIFDGVAADFAGHPILPKAIALVAEAYFEQARFERRKYADARSQDQYRKALLEFERIINDFDEVPFTTAWAYFHAGECYLHLGDRAKAIEYRQKVADDWPDFEYARLARDSAAGMRNEVAALRSGRRPPRPPLRFVPVGGFEKDN